MNKVAKLIKESFFTTTPLQLLKDLFGGIIVALVSIPISMGYAQVAGLPMQYGLYGSVFPILLFGLLTTSKDFVFGVDAAPAALTGAAIASLGIAAGSEEAMRAVPTIALLAACWLLLFFFLRAGRIVRYISTPVMGGFVTGICLTIILMQIPKLFGGSGGMGEAPELISHIISQAQSFHPLSFVLGLGTVIIIVVCRRFIPRVPMSVIVMAAGAALTKLFSLGDYGVPLLPHVESGFIGFGLNFVIPSPDDLSSYLFASLSVAAVILSESLLASRTNAMKDGYELNSSRELLAYSAANFVGAVTGCCPMNGSVSRTGIVRQFGARSQWLSVSAAAAMLAVLYFGTPVIEYLPVPVLTGIVISALLGACEFHEAARLFRQNRRELCIFAAATLGVLILGTVQGVMVGIVLSFFAVIVRAVTPPRALMGVIPGREGFFSLGRSSDARPVQHAVIYRFGGNLFFANVDTLVSDIEAAIRPDTSVVVINAGAVGSIDITAADRLVLLARSMKRRGIRFYITEHVGEVNDMLRKYGAEELVKNGCVRMTVSLALRDAALPYPYILEDAPPPVRKASLRRRSKTGALMLRDVSYTKASKGIQAELEWAFGQDAEKYKDIIADELLNDILHMELSEHQFEMAEQKLRFGRLNLFDEDELIDRLELRLMSMENLDASQLFSLEIFLEHRREHIEQRMLTMDPKIMERLEAQRVRFRDHLRESEPESYEKLQQWRKQYNEAKKDDKNKQ